MALPMSGAAPLMALRVLRRASRVAWTGSVLHRWTDWWIDPGGARERGRRAGSDGFCGDGLLLASSQPGPGKSSSVI